MAINFSDTDIYCGGKRIAGYSPGTLMNPVGHIFVLDRGDRVWSNNNHPDIDVVPLAVKTRGMSIDFQSQGRGFLMNGSNAQYITISNKFITETYIFDSIGSSMSLHDFFYMIFNMSYRFPDEHANSEILANKDSTAYIKYHRASDSSDGDEGYIRGFVALMGSYGDPVLKIFYTETKDDTIWQHFYLNLTPSNLSTTADIPCSYEYFDTGELFDTEVFVAPTD